LKLLAVSFGLFSIIFSFEPTYKELKPGILAVTSGLALRFEPTYKELKLTFGAYGTGDRPSFEPTYKELKLPMDIGCPIGNFMF